MTTLLATGLAIALVVLAAAVIAMLADSRKITRLERTLGVADAAIKQLATERDEARRSLRESLDAQRGEYIRLRMPNPPRAQDVQRSQYLPDRAIGSQPQNRAADGVPEVEQETADEPTRDFTRIVERNSWPKWPGQ